jgi:hypothetical protein
MKTCVHQWAIHDLKNISETFGISVMHERYVWKTLKLNLDKWKKV